jgi:hypothetical protein
MNPEENLEARAALFKALGHPVRLLILNLVRLKPRHGQELATILHLNPATISHHLAKLTDVGLLTSERDQYYQVYSLHGEPLEKTLAEMVQLPQKGLKMAAETDAFRAKVLNTFFVNGRLRQIPAQRKKQQVILEKLLEEFEPEQPYSEMEVNRILLEFHEDVASLRRALIDFKLMTRERGVYTRPAPESAG